MTRAMLSERLRGYDRLWRWLDFAGYLLLVLAFAAGPPFSQVLLGPWLGQPEGSEERRVGVRVASSLIAGVSLLLLVLLSWGTRWTVRKFGLLCPSCGVPLPGRQRYAALGAGKCGRCQARVV